jgi:hypothetical protein
MFPRKDGGLEAGFILMRRDFASPSGKRPTRKGPLTDSIIGLDGRAALFNIEQQAIHK